MCVCVCLCEFTSGHLGRPAKIRGHTANGERGTSQKHEHAARRARTAIPLRSALAPGLYVWADGQGPSAVGGWPLAGVHWEPLGPIRAAGVVRRSRAYFVFFSLSSSSSWSSSSSSSSRKTPHTVPKKPSSATNNLSHCSGWSYSADKLLGQGKETCKRGWTGGRAREGGWGVVLCHYSCKMVALPS